MDHHELNDRFMIAIPPKNKDGFSCKNQTVYEKAWDVIAEQRYLLSYLVRVSKSVLDLLTATGRKILNYRFSPAGKVTPLSQIDEHPNFKIHLQEYHKQFFHWLYHSNAPTIISQLTVGNPKAIVVVGSRVNDKYRSLCKYTAEHGSATWVLLCQFFHEKFVTSESANPPTIEQNDKTHHMKRNLRRHHQKAVKKIHQEFEERIQEDAREEEKTDLKPSSEQLTQPPILQELVAFLKERLPILSQKSAQIKKLRSFWRALEFKEPSLQDVAEKHLSFQLASFVRAEIDVFLEKRAPFSSILGDPSDELQTMKTLCENAITKSLDVELSEKSQTWREFEADRTETIELSGEKIEMTHQDILIRFLNKLFKNQEGTDFVKVDNSLFEEVELEGCLAGFHDKEIGSNVIPDITNLDSQSDWDTEDEMLPLF